MRWNIESKVGSKLGVPPKTTTLSILSTNTLMNKFTACRIIANVMTNKHFMNGWFGDQSDEFKLEQANQLANMNRGNEDRPYTAIWWVEMNIFNMVHYCRIPRHVIVAAFDYWPSGNRWTKY